MKQTHWQTRLGVGSLPCCSPAKPKLKKKKNILCRNDDIEGFTWFTIQAKSATEIG